MLGQALFHSNSLSFCLLNKAHHETSPSRCGGRGGRAKMKERRVLHLNSCSIHTSLAVRHCHSLETRTGLVKEQPRRCKNTRKQKHSATCCSQPVAFLIFHANPWCAIPPHATKAGQPPSWGSRDTLEHELRMHDSPESLVIVKFY